MRITNRLHIWSNKKCKNNDFSYSKHSLLIWWMDQILQYWCIGTQQLFLLQTNTSVKRTIETLYTIVRMCNLIRRNIIRLYESAIFKNALIIIKFANAYIYPFWKDTVFCINTLDASKQIKTIYPRYVITIVNDNTF